MKCLQYANFTTLLFTLIIKPTYLLFFCKLSFNGVLIFVFSRSAVFNLLGIVALSAAFAGQVNHSPYIFLNKTYIKFGLKPFKCQMKKKVIRDGEAGRRGAHSHKVTFTLTL